MCLWRDFCVSARGLPIIQAVMEPETKTDDQDPNKIYELVHTGEYFETSGKYQNAIEIFDKVLEIEPTHAYARMHKGTSFVKLGKYQEAIKLFNKELESNPKNTYALENKNEAVQLYRKQSRETSDVPEIVMALTHDDTENSDAFDLLKVFVVLAVIFIFIVGLVTVFSGGLKGSPSKELTPAQKATAIKDCKNWGGRVIYNSRNEYEECLMNEPI